MQKQFTVLGRKLTFTVIILIAVVFQSISAVI